MNYKNLRLKLLNHECMKQWNRATNCIKQAEVRQEDDRSRRQPGGSFFISFSRDLSQGGVGATPMPLHAQLVPSKTVTHFTHHEWMES